MSKGVINFKFYFCSWMINVSSGYFFFVKVIIRIYCFDDLKILMGNKNINIFIRVKCFIVFFGK